MQRNAIYGGNIPPADIAEKTRLKAELEAKEKGRLKLEAIEVKTLAARDKMLVATAAKAEAQRKKDEAKAVKQREKDKKEAAKQAAKEAKEVC